MLIPKIRWYRCSKCNKTFIWKHKTEFIEKICPLCGHIRIIHSDCGGEIYEYDPMDIKMR